MAPLPKRSYVSRGSGPSSSRGPRPAEVESFRVSIARDPKPARTRPRSNTETPAALQRQIDTEGDRVENDKADDASKEVRVASERRCQSFIDPVATARVGWPGDDRAVLHHLPTLRRGGVHTVDGHVRELFGTEVRERIGGISVVLHEPLN